MDSKQGRKRPVFLNLLQIRLPVTALVSIMHRASGVVMFLSLPLWLCALRQSLASARGFDHVTAYIALPWVKCGFWWLLSAVVYHLIAGIRHLLMDMGVGETLRGARCLSWVTLLLTAGFMIALGVRLW